MKTPKPTKTQLSEWGRALARLRAPKNMSRGGPDYYAKIAKMRKPTCQTTTEK